MSKGVKCYYFCYCVIILDSGYRGYRGYTFSQVIYIQ